MGTHVMICLHLKKYVDRTQSLQGWVMHPTEIIPNERERALPLNIVMVLVGTHLSYWTSILACGIIRKPRIP